MNPKEYKQKALRTMNKLLRPQDDLMHMAAGISGEAGEVLDAVKKHFAYGKPLNKPHVIEELGDLMFYINGMLHLLDTEWEDVMRINIAKLEARYPNLKFDADHAINRNKEAEAEAMKKAG